jgi:hypothetical protein
MAVTLLDNAVCLDAEMHKSWAITERFELLPEVFEASRILANDD